MTLITVVIAYLAIGLLALAVFDLTTKRIRNGLRDASYETQITVANTGVFGVLLGSKLAVVVISVALWIFWPAAIYGAVENRLRKKQGNETTNKEKAHGK